MPPTPRADTNPPMAKQIFAPRWPTIHSRPTLIAVVAVVLAMTLANGLYFDLRAALGHSSGGFLPGPEDRFADIVKVALSFKHITGDLTGSPAFETWPTIYREYLLRNPYGDISSLAAGKLTHFHHPPLSQLIFTLAAVFIAATGSPTLLLWICFGIYALCVTILAGHLHPSDSRSNTPVLVAVTLLCFLSYPAMLVFLRGNYHAGCTSLLATLFLVDCLGRRKVSIGSLLALAVAINLRPTAAIFLFALPASLGLKQSLRAISTVCLLVAAMFLIALLAESIIYPDYNLANFLGGLDIYKSRYILGRGGDAGNASLWALIKNGVTISDTYISYYPSELSHIFVASSALLALVGAKKLLRPGRSEAGIAFVLVALYVLLAPVTAEYHLLIFIAPVLILHACRSGTPYADSWIVFLASSLLLSPKNYIYAEQLSLQTVLNPALLVLALMLIFQESEKLTNSRGLVGEHTGPK